MGMVMTSSIQNGRPCADFMVEQLKLLIEILDLSLLTFDLNNKSRR